MAREGEATAALPASHDTAGNEERDANARYKLLLDIQDAFSSHSGCITTITAGSKEQRDCFSGAALLRWLRDEGGHHLSAYSVDFSHEGALFLVVSSPATQRG